MALNCTGGPEFHQDLVAEEYFEAAKALVSRQKAEGRSGLAAYPILYLYRHAVELFLKSLLILGHRFSGLPCDSDTTNALNRHAVLPLLNGVDRLLTGRPAGFGLSESDGQQFREVMQELDRIDPTGEAFRYTVTKGGSPTVEQDFTFSLRNISEILDPILDRLSNACLEMREHYRNLAEAGYPDLGTDYADCDG